LKMRGRIEWYSISVALTLLGVGVYRLHWP
jgi:hypothetical protein